MKMKAVFGAAMLAVGLISGCASLSEQPSGDVVVKKDSFEAEKTIVSVDSILGMGEQYNLFINLEWHSGSKDVYLDAIYPQIENVVALKINADGQMIDGRVCSAHTDFGATVYSGLMYVSVPSFSLRRFCISTKEYEKIAQSKLVKMKVSTYTKYMVASFSPVGSKDVSNSSTHAKAFSGFTTALRQNGAF